jgi:hypothetical protein
MKKLKVLKWVIVALSTIIILSWKVVRIKKVEKLAIPLVWLRHYLVGSGEPMNLPEEIAEEAWQSLLEGIAEGGITHSTRYKGRGFWGRPTMFYLVGGFSYRKVKRRRNGSIFISGVDVYDWHPNEKGEYFSSPFNKVVVKILNLIYGEEYFPLKGFPSGNPAISNKLWQDFQSVGAKNFNTYIRINIPQEYVEGHHKLKYVFEPEGGDELLIDFTYEEED